MRVRVCFFLVAYTLPVATSSWKLFGMDFGPAEAAAARPSSSAAATSRRRSNSKGRRTKRAADLPDEARLCRSAEGAAPRGSHPARTRKRGDDVCPAAFRCATDGVALPRAYVDDGYCDCADGSDEVGNAACSGRAATGAFFCRDSGLHRTIPTSRVDDGVCDCCDGSDEPPSTCANECAAALLAWETRTTARLARLTAGVAARATIAKRTDAAKHSLVDQLDAMERQVRYYDQIGVQLQAQPRSPQVMMQLRKLGMARRNALNALKSLDAVATSALSHNDALFTLLAGPCFESTLIPEKVLKGGSTNYVQKRYKFVLCPFRHILQLHANTSAWALADCADKHTERSEVACAALRHKAEAQRSDVERALAARKHAVAEAIAAAKVNASVSQRSVSAAAGVETAHAVPPAAIASAAAAAAATAAAAAARAKAAGEFLQSARKSDAEQTVLGVWDEWLPGSDHSVMVYTKPSRGGPNGGACENGVVRHVHVHLECGLENAIDSVAENGMCAYTMRLKTPLVCTKAAVARTKTRIASVTARVAAAAAMPQ